MAIYGKDNAEEAAVYTGKVSDKVLTGTTMRSIDLNGTGTVAVSLFP